MIRKFGWILVLGCLLTGCDSRLPREVRVIEEVRHQLGDNPAWAEPAFDDSAWSTVAFSQVPGTDGPAGGGIVWLRARVQLSSVLPAPGRALVLAFGAMATCQVFWDGEPLASAGVPGASRALEVPGPISQALHVSDRLATPGLPGPPPCCEAGSRYTAALTNGTELPVSRRRIGDLRRLLV